MEERLIMLKGKKRVRAKQVTISRESLNSGDVFLLETDQKIFHWNGKKSSRPERTKGVDLSHRLNRLHGSRLPVIQMDEGKTDNEDDFWAKLGGRGDIRDEAAGGDDGEFEKDEDEHNKLYRVTDTMELQLQATGSTGVGLRREDLNSDAVYLLDCGNEVYLWSGKRSPADLRRDAIPVANNLLQKG
jgi:gelsolin